MFQERSELHVGLENLQKQLRGMQDLGLFRTNEAALSAVDGSNACFTDMACGCLERLPTCRLTWTLNKLIPANRFSLTGGFQSFC